MYRQLALAERNGCSSTPELLFRFALWAGRHTTPPSPRQIAERFGVSKATSYRWHHAFCAAAGVPPVLHTLDPTGGKRSENPASSSQENPTDE